MKEEQLLKIIELHKFFVKTSPIYMTGKTRLKYLLGYPLAYARFMYFAFKDRGRFKQRTNKRKQKRWGQKH